MEATAIETAAGAPGLALGRYEGTLAGRVFDALQRREGAWAPEQKLWFAVLRQATVEARRYRDAQAFFSDGLYLHVTDALGLDRHAAYRLARVLGQTYRFEPAPPEVLENAGALVKREPRAALPQRGTDLVYAPRRTRKQPPAPAQPPLRERILAALPVRRPGIATARLMEVVAPAGPEVFRRTLMELHDEGAVAPDLSDAVSTPVRWRRARNRRGA